MKLSHSLAVFSAASLLATSASAQDDCASAAPVMDSVPTAFDNTAAMDEGLAFGCGSGAAFDLWFSYTAAADGPLTASLCGSTFDTRMEIYDSCGGSALDCNDDSCGLQSELTVTATGGTTYFIRAAGWNGATGAGELIVTGPQINDECATAEDVFADSPIAYDTTIATPSADAWACTGNTPKDLWYTFTATADFMYTADVCNSNFDTRLEVFEGDCGTLVSLDCNDDSCGLQSSVTWSGLTGMVYSIRVGGFGASSEGQGELLVSGPPPIVANDECVGAIGLLNGVSESFDNTLATNSAGAPGWTCGGSTTAALDVWYSFTPLFDGMVTVDTEGSVGDTRLALYEGSCGTLSLVDCDDDGGTGLLSSITVMGTAGTTYFARVAGFSGSVIDAGVITATYADSIPNDDCSGALPVGLGMGTFSNVGATDSLVDMSCVFNGELSDVWFSFTSPSTCPITVDLSGSEYDTGMVIYSGDCMTLTEVDCDDDGGTGLDSLITFDATAGDTYLIQIGGFNGANGAGTINITEGTGIGTLVCTGVANSTGVGASLKLTGSDIAADNDLTITINSLPLDSMGYVIHSMETNTVMNPGGSQGDICIASFTIGRFAGTVLDSGSTGSASFSPDLTALPTSMLGVTEPAVAGETRYFQHWYRDVDGSGMPTSNFSSAEGITFN